MVFECHFNHLLSNKHLPQHTRSQWLLANLNPDNLRDFILRLTLISTIGQRADFRSQRWHAATAVTAANSKKCILGWAMSGWSLQKHDPLKVKSASTKRSEFCTQVVYFFQFLNVKESSVSWIEPPLSSKGISFFTWILEVFFVCLFWLRPTKSSYPTLARIENMPTTRRSGGDTLLGLHFVHANLKAKRTHVQFVSAPSSSLRKASLLSLSMILISLLYFPLGVSELVAVQLLGHWFPVRIWHTWWHRDWDGGGGSCWRVLLLVLLRAIFRRPCLRCFGRTRKISSIGNLHTQGGNLHKQIDP